MSLKYSEIRSGLSRGKYQDFKSYAAPFTHYLHADGSSREQFRKHARELVGETEELPDIEKNFEFDVPYPPTLNPKFTFIDLFAGIGGFRIALQESGGKCVFSSEWNKFAKKTYEANFGEVPFGDITQIDASDIPDHDVLVGGFPCQPFSIAGVSKKNALGKQHGFLDKTQGTLFFDVARIIEKKKPRAFLLENVKNLKSHDEGNTYQVIMTTLRELGYHVSSNIIDARDYVPQHRERIFIVGFLQSEFGDDLTFEFPHTPESVQRFGDILESTPDERYTLTNNLWEYLQNYAAKHKAKGNGFGFGLTDLNGVSRTLSARYYKDGSEVLVPQKKGENPRRLTPLECKRLMGFPEDFRISGIGVSDTQLYKQFGNSVAVPVVRAVSLSMLQVLLKDDRDWLKKMGEHRSSLLKSDSTKAIQD
jgi:DNA (cytosine-5)-methyltransferase 1